MVMNQRYDSQLQRVLAWRRTLIIARHSAPWTSSSASLCNPLFPGYLHSAPCTKYPPLPRGVKDVWAFSVLRTKPPQGCNNDGRGCLSLAMSTGADPPRILTFTVADSIDVEDAGQKKNAPSHLLPLHSPLSLPHPLLPLSFSLSLTPFLHPFLLPSIPSFLPPSLPLPASLSLPLPLRISLQLPRCLSFPPAQNPKTRKPGPQTLTPKPRMAAGGGAKGSIVRGSILLEFHQVTAEQNPKKRPKQISSAETHNLLRPASRLRERNLLSPEPLDSN